MKTVNSVRGHGRVVKLALQWTATRRSPRPIAPASTRSEVSRVLLAGGNHLALDRTVRLALQWTSSKLSPQPVLRGNVWSVVRHLYLAQCDREALRSWPLARRFASLSGGRHRSAQWIILRCNAATCRALGRCASSSGGRHGGAHHGSSSVAKPRRWSTISFWLAPVGIVRCASSSGGRHRGTHHGSSSVATPIRWSTVSCWLAFVGTASWASLSGGRH